MSVGYKRLAEDASIGMTITPDVSTLGMTVYAYLVDPYGTKVQVGSASGLAASSAISITLDLSTAGIDAGEEYSLEVVADPTATNPVTLLPNQTYERYIIEVFQVDSITDD